MRHVDDARVEALDRDCRRSLFPGRVQGVFYRATCVRKAQSLGLTGYARNLADGRVEVLACGDEAAVERVRGLVVGRFAGLEGDGCRDDGRATARFRLTGFSSA